jgi:hypothetical protein
MIVALIDNGSLEPAAHRHLRAAAANLSKRCGVPVHAVSWKHSDRVPPEALGGTPAWTLARFVRSMFSLGQREFIFVPFFISAQGAIGSALHADLKKLQEELGGLEFAFTDGLAARGALAGILAARIRETVVARDLRAPPVIVVDHGGPSPASASLRDQVAVDVRSLLGASVGPLTAASMEGVHPPLLADQLAAADFAGNDVVVAMLFLSPGRHAGAEGDVAQIAKSSGSRCHLTALVGDHPDTTDTLASALRDELATRQLAPPAGAGRHVN